MPLMMSSALRLHLDRRFCFRQPGRKPSPQSADECNAILLAIEIDSTDALPPIEQQFYETSSKGKIPLLQRLLLASAIPLVWCFAIPKRLPGCLRRAE